MQIFVADLWACFGGNGWGAFHDIRDLTAFADYRIPQVLQALGIVRISSDFQKQLHRHYLWDTFDPEIVELRGISLVALELLRDEIVKQTGKQLTVAALDFCLWDLAKDPDNELLSGSIDQLFPFHRTRSHYY